MRCVMTCRGERRLTAVLRQGEAEAGLKKNRFTIFYWKPTTTSNLRAVVEVVPVVAGADPVVIGGSVVGLVVGVGRGVVELAGLGVLAGGLGVESSSGLAVESLEHLKRAGGREGDVSIRFRKARFGNVLSELHCTQVHLHCYRARNPSPEVREQQVSSSNWGTCAWPLASMRGWPAVMAQRHPSSLPSATQVCSPSPRDEGPPKAAASLQHALPSAGPSPRCAMGCYVPQLSPRPVWSEVVPPRLHSRFRWVCREIDPILYGGIES